MSKDTRYNTKELMVLHKRFQRDYPSGKITRSEFVTFYQRMFSADPEASKDFCEHVFNRYDIDGNGSIDFKEFMTSMSVVSRGTSEEKLLWVFKIYDADDDGYLVEKEIVEVLTAIYKCRCVDNATSKAVVTARKILRIADDNRDGRISESEFIRHAQDCPEIKDMLQGL